MISTLQRMAEELWPLILNLMGLGFTIGDSTNGATFASDGELTLAGTARVVQYEWISASAVQAAGAKPATIGVNGGGWVVASFADNQEQQIQANIKVPADMDTGTDSYICLGWSSPTISSVCDWEVEVLVTALNEDTEGASTVSLQSNETSSATADGLVVSSFTIPNANIGTSDVCLHIVVQRDGNDAADTLGDVAELHGIILKYTSYRLGETT
jgi:hypothetical protein